LLAPVTTIDDEKLAGTDLTGELAALLEVPV